MGVKLLALICAGIGSCSLFDVNIGSTTVKGSFTTASVAGGGCGTDNAQAFKDVELPGTDLLKTGNLDVNVACLKSAKFTLSTTLDTLTTNTADTCTGPAGMLALTSYEISYDYKDGSTTKNEKITFDCPDPSLNYSGPVADIQTKIDACMAVINTQGQDQLRTAINRHPEKITISGVGTCSADSCFSAKYTMNLKLENGVVSVGGDCK